MQNRQICKDILSSAGRENLRVSFSDCRGPREWRKPQRIWRRNLYVWLLHFTVWPGCCQGTFPTVFQTQILETIWPWSTVPLPPQSEVPTNFPLTCGYFSNMSEGNSLDSINKYESGLPDWVLRILNRIKIILRIANDPESKMSYRWCKNLPVRYLSLRGTSGFGTLFQYLVSVPKE